MIEYRHEFGMQLAAFFNDLRDHVGPQMRTHMLLSNHWAEIATHTDLMKLDIDYARYRQLVEKGALVVVTARDDNMLIGYVTFFLMYHPHYKTVLVASEDIHYVDPAYRHRGVGTGMLKKAEETLVGKGVRFATMRTKVHADHGALLRDLGYAAMETVYGKEIGV